MVTVPLVTLLLLMPAWFDKAVPELSVAYPEPIHYEMRVSASGKLSAAGQTAVEASLPMIPKYVYAEEGDTVKAGQVLATVDREASMSALLSLLAAAGDIGQEFLSAYGLDDFSLESLNLPDTIVATSGGVISEMNLTSGTLCYPTQTAAVIADSDDLILTLDVPESDAEQVEVGQTVRYTASATGDTRYFGTVRKVPSSAHEVLSGTTKATVVSVEVEPNDPGSLKPGYSANGQIITGAVDKALSLPYTAIGQDEQGEFVYTFDHGRAVRQSVEVGQEFAYYAEVLAGIEETTPVILDAASVSKNGALLRGKLEDAQWTS